MNVAKIAELLKNDNKENKIMASFPFFRFPYNNYYYHYYPPYNLNNRNVLIIKKNLSNNLENTSNNQRRSTAYGTSN